MVSSATSVGMPGPERIAWACSMDMAGQPAGNGASDMVASPMLAPGSSAQAVS